ncbi:MAG: hypothetical protein HFE86_06155 [Clostridiales bacterium]|nr:hypothetical protein [Clostridiales bacterium]
MYAERIDFRSAHRGLHETFALHGKAYFVLQSKIFVRGSMPRTKIHSISGGILSFPLFCTKVRYFLGFIARAFCWKRLYKWPLNVLAAKPFARQAKTGTDYTVPVFVVGKTRRPRGRERPHKESAYALGALFVARFRTIFFSARAC